MKILVISPGKSHDYADAAADYAKRLDRRFELEWALPASGELQGESKAILKLIKDTDEVVLLDERGKDTTSNMLAQLLDDHLSRGTKRLVFVVGGAFGVDQAVRERANKTIKLSSLTLPHQLVRLVLAEQLYRAGSIIAGGKYHHA